MLQRKETTAASANPCSAMESGNHSKNGASLKSLTSKGKLLFKSFLIISMLTTSVLYSCNKSEKHEEEENEDEKMEEIIGTWRSEEEGFFITFKSDGSYTYKEGTYTEDGTYTFRSSELTLYDADEDVSDRFSVVSINSTILELRDEDGDYWTFKKVNSEDSDNNRLLAPTGVTAKVEGNRIKISWEPVEGADYYDLVCKYDAYTSFENNIQECYFMYVPKINEISYSFEVQAIRNTPYEIRSSYSNTVSCFYIRSGGGSETGLYMGVIGFNEELNEKSISLLTDYKNVYNTNNFTSFVDGLVMKPATSFYYAVDNAITRLENAALPEDLENVSIITFTDGLDNASIDLNTDYNSRDAYRDAVKKRIADTKINGLKINAYSIGVRGNDVNDVEAFRAGLVAMASKEENANEVTNMDEVYETFSEIASSLYNENQSKTVKLKITGGYDDGTKIRFTWDDVADAADSKYYIEGTYKRNGTTRVLENVVYHGIMSSSGKTITGEVSGVYVTFAFKDVIEWMFGSQKIQQWEYVSSTAQWQRNSEFGQTGDIETIVDKKSAVVMLVLDCTTSLGSNDFGQMKEAATNFIEILTDY